MGTYAANTEVSQEKSRAEIETTLRRYGADAFSYGWEEGKAVIVFRANNRHVRFEIVMPDPKNEEFTTYRHSSGKIKERSPDVAYKAWEQATRQKWRALPIVGKCPTCGRVFPVYQHYRPRMFCGRICANKARIKHGCASNGAVSTEYNSWVAMKKRCADLGNKDYGGRGIGVCKRWLESFENFLADMGPKPGPDFSIERKDNNKNYTPDNCVWGSPQEQANNRAITVFLTLRGRTQTRSAWAKELGISIATINARQRLGWTDGKILTKPLRNLKKEVVVERAVASSKE